MRRSVRIASGAQARRRTTRATTSRRREKSGVDGSACALTIRSPVTRSRCGCGRVDDRSGWARQQTQGGAGSAEDARRSKTNQWRRGVRWRLGQGNRETGRPCARGGRAAQPRTGPTDGDGARDAETTRSKGRPTRRRRRRAVEPRAGTSGICTRSMSQDSERGTDVATHGAKRRRGARANGPDGRTRLARSVLARTVGV